MTPPLRKPKVLIVDDHAANRLAYKSILEDGYAVSLGASGAEALELALKEDYAVILLDVRMPAMDGFETAKLLRMRARTQHTPIVFITAYDRTPDRINEGYISGATDYLFSPIDPEFLKFKVAAYTQLYLRNEALQIHISHLNNVVQSLQNEINRRLPAEDALRNQVKRLETTIENLKLELMGTPA